MTTTTAHHPRPVRDLPKAHLHVHLDGSYPRAAVLDLAHRRGVVLDLPDRFRDVWHFFDAYGQVPPLVSSGEDLALLCRALVLAEAADGVVYLEPGIEPQLYAPRLGTLEEVTAIMLDALAEGARQTGIEVGAVLTINTDTDAAIADELSALALAGAGAGVTALGTAGFTEPAGLDRFAAAARAARDAGLDVVAHAGQTGGPDGVREAVDVLGATRIAHGVRSVEDPALLRQLAADGIVCDVAPVSNVALGIVADLASHPAPAMVDAGVVVTLNADDPLWFGASASDQYAVARQVWGMDDEALAALARTGARARGMGEHTRAALLRGVDAWLAAPAPAQEGRA